MKQPTDAKKPTNLLRKLRYPIQSTALVIALLSPFVLYWALNQNNIPLAVTFFVLMVLSLVLTALAG